MLSNSIDRLIGGDVTAFKEIYDRYWSQVLAVCERLIGLHEEAAELTQDIFYSLWVRRASLSPAINLSAYLHQAAKNQSFRYLRDKQRLERRQAGYNPATESTASAEDIQFKELQRTYAKSMSAIREPAKTIFRLSREEHLTHREIADQLNVSIKTVEYHMGKTLQLLRHSLRDYLKS
ncbi:RNA polymerase sigma-70 factor [Parapedobacter koreensis]|uniref:RNA polymerase sigma-70 factor, ECF subfamily n=1 Tax=Parapedobacter koreensis TaxID=332977 RepID=A0A1H7JUT1_9SPHI|nr:RNA polymerase sigma-70 factor [Parapedobacter koreensis]SEK78343.1 RNA polymerase sigma-70 factor, ECF subfamily [Parapedobacter koreensis]